MLEEESRNGFRALQMPCRHTAEEQCSAELAGFVKQHADLETSPAVWVQVQLESWRATGIPSELLASALDALFRTASEYEPATTKASYAKIGPQYFALHLRLVNHHGQSFDEAVSTISHSSMILAMALENKLSAAQIARILSREDSHAELSRQVVAEVLAASAALCKIDSQQAQHLFAQDSNDEVGVFRDADFLVSAQEVAMVAGRFCNASDFLRSLQVLSPIVNARGEIESPYTPYLQILHYQCTIAEFFDHAMRDLYEFSPRGSVANWLFAQYPKSIAGASNPFLNNAKAVEVIDHGWVRSKKSSEAAGARALLNTLSRLDGMGFLARRDVSRWIRLWLHRILRVAGEQPLLLPKEINWRQVQALSAAVAGGNTRTYGILEQRLLDVASFVRHPGLRSRGLGDAVNTTNLSQRKFGDCEFLDFNNFNVFAYEAHGGVLTQIYIDQHLLSLEKSALNRVEELASVAELDQWAVTVFFVAHDISRVGEIDVFLHGLRVKVLPITFLQVCDELMAAERGELIGLFNSLVMKPLHSGWTPNKVKSEIARLIE